MRSKIKTMLLLVTTLVVTLMMSSMVFAAPGKVAGLTQTDAAKTYVEVEWDAILSANKYEVMYSDSSTDWKTNVGVETAYSTSRTIYDLTPGKSYYVRVRAIDNAGTYGEWSDVLEVVTCPEAVTNLKQTAATTTSATFSWTAVSGATSYEVYKVVDNNASYIGATKSTSCTIKGLNDKTTYYIYVYAIRSSQTASAISYGTYLSSYNINLIPAKMAKPVPTQYWYNLKEIKLSWDKMSYADGYEVELYKYNGKKATKKITVKSGSTDYTYLEKIKANTFYKVRVRAYTTINGKIQKGAWSDYNYIGQQIEPELKYASGKKKIKISWNKMKGAKNYTVYVSTKQKSGYKKVATTKKTSYTLTKFKKKKLKAGKRYYVYVVANRKVGKKTYKSGSQYCFYLY